MKAATSSAASAVVDWRQCAHYGTSALEDRNLETYHSLAVLCIGEADVDGLIDEEDVCVRVPRLLEGMRLLGRIGDAAWTEFHEESHGRGRARTAVRPEYDIVLTGIVPALEEVEEQMSSLDVYVTRICAA